MKYKNMLENPILATDGYKLCHIDQYPEGTEMVYETWTPRMTRIPGINHVIYYGIQGVMQEITDKFNKYFFDIPLSEVLSDYDFIVQNIFSITNPEFANRASNEHIKDLHELGYLPLQIKAVEEGTFIPIGVPMFTIQNTHPKFSWLPGYLESQLSSYIWPIMTAATIADKYKRILNYYADKTDDASKVNYQAGDFSMRGMTSPDSSMRSSGGHLLSFGVSATVLALPYIKSYYDAEDTHLIYTPATEHSVMSSYGEEEREVFLHLIQNVYPTGNISVVSDTYDFWNVIDTILPSIKDEIMNRDGKLVIRPDSGDPADILCGDPTSDNPTVQKGLIESLYETFGGHVNEKGYKVLDSHIGAIYGDSITPERTLEICKRLEAKGFASTNVILGIGSFTYQYNTRDTFGFALKATAEIRNGEYYSIQKKPATDTGNFKTSHKGFVAVVKEDGDYKAYDNQTLESLEEIKDVNELQDVYINGKFVRTQTFEEIRERVAQESKRVYGGSKSW